MSLIKKNIEEIGKIIDQIKFFSNSGVPIIVEGIKDKNSLELLGITQNIITLEGKRLFQIGDIFSDEKEVIILTDFDPEGRKLAHKIQKELLNRGINPNLSFWKKLKYYFKKYKKDIESLGKFLSQIHEFKPFL